MEHLFMQIADPPADFLSFLLWFIGILVAVVAFFFKLLQSAMQSRIADRDATIATLREEKTKLEAQRDGLIDEFKTSFDVANQVFTRLLDNQKK